MAETGAVQNPQPPPHVMVSDKSWPEIIHFYDPTKIGAYPPFLLAAILIHENFLLSRRLPIKSRVLQSEGDAVNILYNKWKNMRDLEQRGLTPRDRVISNPTVSLYYR